MILFNPITRLKTTYELGPSVQSLIKGVGKELNQVGSFIAAKYPMTDTYRSHYDGALERAVSLQERHAEMVSDAVYDLGEMNSRNADQIVSSISRMNRNVGIGLGRVADGVESLRSDFKHEMGELIYAVQDVSDKLAEANFTLKHPARTSAYELREDAVECWRNGWIDKAVQKMEESKVHFDIDPMPYKFLGTIYLLQPESHDLQKAEGNFVLAHKYFEPYSTEMAAEAMYFLGATHWAQGNKEKAIQATEKALQITPDYAEAKYQLAEFKAMTGQKTEALELLSQAIQANKGYFRKAMMDESFDSMRSELNSFFGSLVQFHKKQAHEVLLCAAAQFAQLRRLHSMAPQPEAYEKVHALLGKAARLDKEARDLVDTQMIIVLAGIISTLAKDTLPKQTKTIDEKIAQRHQVISGKLSNLESFKLVDTSDAHKLLDKAGEAKASSCYEDAFANLNMAENAYHRHLLGIFGSMKKVLEDSEKLAAARKKISETREVAVEDYVGGTFKYEHTFRSLFSRDAPCFIDGYNNTGIDPAKAVTVWSNVAPYNKKQVYYVCEGCFKKHFNRNEKALGDLFREIQYLPPKARRKGLGGRDPLLKFELELAKSGGVRNYYHLRSIFKDFGFPKGMYSHGALCELISKELNSLDANKPKVLNAFAQYTVVA